MLILVLNSGSSSLKYQLFNAENENTIAEGIVEKIGLKGSFIKHGVCQVVETEMGVEHHKKNNKIECIIKDAKSALNLVLKLLVDDDFGILTDLHQIDAVGHRIVHGGSKFSEAVQITPEVLSELELLNDIAPLHNPPAIVGINACMELMPGVPNVGVFDTSFHQTMTQDSYIYPISYEMYEKHGIRRYGFHGTSHRFVSEKISGLLNKPVEDTKIITCHLGNGSSITAIKGGKSVDTSMGFTPLEGIMMGTRSGAIDPAICNYLMTKENMTGEEVLTYLNKQSGLLGLSGVSNDVRELREAVAMGNERAKLALDVFNNQLIKLIGGYAALLNGVDAIVFTAGIGENDTELRQKVCESLTFLGLDLDLRANIYGDKFREITTMESRVKAFVVPTNEELVIARDTKDVVLANDLLQA